MENEKEDPVYIPPPKQLKLNITEKKLDLEEERSFKEDFSEHPPTFNLIRSQFRESFFYSKFFLFNNIFSS